MAPASGRGPISTLSAIILSMGSKMRDLWSVECSLANFPAFTPQPFPLNCLFSPTISILCPPHLGSFLQQLRGICVYVSNFLNLIFFFKHLHILFFRRKDDVLIYSIFSCVVICVWNIKNFFAVCWVES